MTAKPVSTTAVVCRILSVAGLACTLLGNYQPYAERGKEAVLAQKVHIQNAAPALQTSFLKTDTDSIPDSALL
ncbi:MAG: hypothetical protein LZF60_80183 [Nitrospira sp.]|nr:MAG: hypothetical protein LZF60_80183 [Nitrospira sp.]